MQFNKYFATLLLVVGCFSLAAHCVLADASSANEIESPGYSGRILASPAGSSFAGRILGRRPDADTNGNADSVKLQTYERFMQLYNKTYSPEELPRRMALFFERLQRIVEARRLFEQGKQLFDVRVNGFADLSEQELKALTGTLPDSGVDLGVFIGGDKFNASSMDASSGALGADDNDDDDGGNMNVKGYAASYAKDWRQSGCVAPPMRQMNCSSCYALASMATLETMLCLDNRKKAYRLSPQQILDCASKRSSRFQNDGCNYGLLHETLEYLYYTDKVALLGCYPYVMREEQCKLAEVEAQQPGCLVPTSPAGKQLKIAFLRSEFEMMQFVATIGPVVTSFESTNAFFYYSGGVFDDPACGRTPNDINHTVSIVGYGSEMGVDYWLVKNTWGTEWADGGYAKVKRGTNACSMGMRGAFGLYFE